MSNCMCFYDQLIEIYEGVVEEQKGMTEYFDDIRTNGYSEPTIIKMESTVEVLAGICKRIAIQNFELKIENDEMKRKLNEINNLVSEEL